MGDQMTKRDAATLAAQYEGRDHKTQIAASGKATRDSAIVIVAVVALVMMACTAVAVTAFALAGH